MRNERYYLIFVYGESAEKTEKTEDFTEAVKIAIDKMVELVKSSGITKTEAASRVCILEDSTTSQDLGELFGSFLDD